MAPEFHHQLIEQRAADLRREAVEYRRAREATQRQEAEQKRQSSGERRRGLFRKPASA
ncbi:hypothetical protein ACFYY8_11585 [Streptosporangium sp. NPDC001559]|uniref:hypothetical protein n=1 Tax=Streptosporangium sp. NPDC001559 TaxID=3366187 RepID=UPI0036EC9F9E